MPVQIAQPHEGRADILLIGVATDSWHRDLLDWQTSTPELHEFLGDAHRLQLEHWVWTFKAELAGKRILDIGAQYPRRWFGEGYKTFGHTDDTESDIQGNLLCLSHMGLPKWDAIVCTEVLEHCENPIAACKQMYAALAPGGLLLVTSPFMWPDHHTDDYADYWRFCEQSWPLMLKEFREVKVTPARWTSEGLVLLDLARRFEGWGFLGHVTATTGYMVEARK